MKKIPLFSHYNIYNHITNYIKFNKMKEEYKRRIKTQMDSAMLRLKIIDEIMAGKRSGTQQDALTYMKEAMRSINTANEIIDIS